MSKHLLGILVVTALIVLITLLPFLPGRYDALAMPLSLLALLFGKVGLLLVPAGVLWLATKRNVLAIVALIVATVVWLIVSVGAFYESVTLGIAAIVLWACVVLRFRRRPASRALAWYLVVVPVAVFLAQLALARPVTESGRSRAIANSAPLIAAIERHRAVHGRYPPSLIALWPDIRPGLIGVREYRYEPAGAAYNLSFELPSLRLGTREIVVYNPRGEHTMTAHTLDLLELTPEQLALERTRGHNALHRARQPNWKYYWFD